MIFDNACSYHQKTFVKLIQNKLSNATRKITKKQTENWRHEQRWQQMCKKRKTTQTQNKQLASETDSNETIYRLTNTNEETLTGNTKRLRSTIVGIHVLIPHK